MGLGDGRAVTWGRPWVAVRLGACWGAWAALLAVVPAHPARAGLGGSLETTYSHGKVWSEDSTGDASLATSDLLRNRLTLGYTDLLLPLLSVRVGGIFDGSRSWAETDGERSDSKTARLSSYADVSFGSPFVRAGAGYNYLQRMSAAGDEEAPVVVRESYQASLGFRPEDLPTLELRAVRTNSFDQDREQSDTRQDSLSWSSRFAAGRGLDLSYQGSYSRSLDMLEGTEVEDVTNSGRVLYSRGFFRGRGSLSTSYNLSRQDTDTRAGRTREFPVPVPPLTGLSAVSLQEADVVLDVNPALVNGDRAASGAVDLGLRTNVGDRTPRQVGLDFGLAQEVSGLHVWVDRDLTAAVAGSFTWKVYTSDDNRFWRLHRTVSSAPFGPIDFRFEVRFPSVRTRYVKVVVSPLAPTVSGATDFPSILVTEVDGFEVVPASRVEGHTSTMAQTFDVSARALLLEDPSLSYNFSFFYTNALKPDTARFALLNGLSLSRRLGDTWYATGRVGREDSVDPDKHVYSYTYSASVAGNPLPTLSHNLVFSGRWQQDELGSGHTESVSLSNSAALYRGVDVSLTGNVSQGTLTDGGRSSAAGVSAGVNLVPHPKLSVNASYSQSWSEQSGGAAPDTSSRTQGGEVSASLSPTSALYLFASVGYSKDTNGPSSTVQSYAAGWSPLRGGALQLNMNYTETLRSEGSSRERGFSPTVRWNIGPKLSADLSYSWLRADSDTQRLESQSINVLFRASF